MAVDLWTAAAWSLPLATSALVVGDIPVVAGAYTDSVKGKARGSITVPTEWDRLTEVINPNTDTATIIHLYQDKTYVGSFFAKRTSSRIADDGVSTTVISGPGLDDMGTWAPVLFYDWPTNPSVDPDHVWGNETAAGSFTNGTFEDDFDSMGGNSGFENAETAPWGPASTDDWFTAPILVTTTSTEKRTGTYSMLVEINGGDHAGVQASIPVQDGGRYTVQGYAKDLSFAADGATSYWLGIGPVTDSAQIHSAQTRIVNGFAWRNIGNSVWASTPSDGTWQQFTLDVTLDSGTDTATLASVHNGAAAKEWVVDDVTISGPGIGVSPWEAVTAHEAGATPPTMTTFTVDDTNPNTGSYCLKFDGTIPSGSIGAKLGVGQTVSGLTPGKTYRFIASVDHDNTGVSEDFVMLARRPYGEWLTQDAFTVTGGTYTENVLEFTPTTTDVDVEIRWSETGPDTSPTIYVDDVNVTGGQAAASPGTIITALLDDVTTDHTAETPPYDIDVLGFLVYNGFSATLDSNGDAWSPTEIDYRARRGRTLADVFRDFHRLGYETRWKWTPGIGAHYDLDVYNPYDPVTFTGGYGTDRRTSIGGPGTVTMVMDGDGVAAGSVVQAPMGANIAISEGADGAYSVAQDTGAQTHYDARAVYGGDVNYVASKTVDSAAAQLLVNTSTYTSGAKVTINAASDDRVPWQDYSIGDRVTAVIAGIHSDRRVVRIATSWNTAGTKHTVDLDTESYDAIPTVRGYTPPRTRPDDAREGGPRPTPGPDPYPPPPNPPGLDALAATVQRLVDDFQAASNTYVDAAATTITGGTTVTGATSHTALTNIEPTHDMYQPFSQAGTVTTTVPAGVHRFYVRHDFEIVDVEATVATAPSGGSVVVDCNINGTSVFVGGSEPAIATGTNSSGAVTPDGTATGSDGDYLTIAIDSTTAPAADLTVIVRYRRT